MTEHEIQVLDAMERYGGGFVSRLAKAWMNADPSNFEKLRVAFSDYWQQYEAVVKQQASQAKSERSRP